MSLSKISGTPNLDVTTAVRNQFEIQGEKAFQVEASITQFTPKTKEADSTIVKKITVSALGSSVDVAQDKALEKAVTLLGL